MCCNIECVSFEYTTFFLFFFFSHIHDCHTAVIRDYHPEMFSTILNYYVCVLIPTAIYFFVNTLNYRVNVRILLLAHKAQADMCCVYTIYDQKLRLTFVCQAHVASTRNGNYGSLLFPKNRWHRKEVEIKEDFYIQALPDNKSKLLYNFVSQA